MPAIGPLRSDLDDSIVADEERPMDALRAGIDRLRSPSGISRETPAKPLVRARFRVPLGPRG